MTQPNGGLDSVFGEGLRCAGGTMHRLGTQTNSGGASQYPGAGDPPVTVRAFITALGVRAYQVWSRSAAVLCTPDNYPDTGGQEVGHAEVGHQEGRQQGPGSHGRQEDDPQEADA